MQLRFPIEKNLFVLFRLTKFLSRKFIKRSMTGAQKFNRNRELSQMRLWLVFIILEKLAKPLGLSGTKIRTPRNL